VSGAASHQFQSMKRNEQKKVLHFLNCDAVSVGAHERVVVASGRVTGKIQQSQSVKLQSEIRMKVARVKMKAREREAEIIVCARDE
jgi:hypothetical protein